LLAGYSWAWLAAGCLLLRLLAAAAASTAGCWLRQQRADDL
jgi:hypothetical protein